jgi:hypothetical protein
LRRESRTFELEHCGQMPLLNNARAFCPSLIEKAVKRVSILLIHISPLGTVYLPRHSQLSQELRKKISILPRAKH